jgi:CRP/FNR family transcriptional regulator
MKKLSIDVKWERPPRCKNCAIRDLHLFSALKEEDYAFIHEVKFGNGELLYRVGESAKYVYTLLEGIVKLTQYSLKDEEHKVQLLSRGNVIGLEALTGQTYRHTASAIDTALLCRIPITVITNLI